MIWIADLITRRGIGHGVSVLVLVGYGISIFSSLSEIKIISYQHSPLFYFLLFFIVAAALVTLIVWIEKSHKKIPVKFKDGLKASLHSKSLLLGSLQWNGHPS